MGSYTDGNYGVQVQAENRMLFTNPLRRRSYIAVLIMRR